MRSFWMCFWISSVPKLNLIDFYIYPGMGLVIKVDFQWKLGSVAQFNREPIKSIRLRLCLSSVRFCTYAGQSHATKATKLCYQHFGSAIKRFFLTSALSSYLVWQIISLHWTNMVVYTLQQHFAKSACDLLTEDADFGKKESSFQMKLILILNGHKNPACLHRKVDASITSLGF